MVITLAGGVGATMRGFALALTALLLLAPLGLAEDGDGSSTSSSSSSSSSSSTSPSPSPTQPCADTRDGSPERYECIKRYCEEHPSDSRCPKPSASGTDSHPCANETTSAGKESCIQRYCSQHQDPRCPRDGGEQPGQDGCKDEETDQAERHCEQAVRQIKDEPGRAWIDFQVDAANATLLSYKVDGLVVLDAIHLGLDGGNLTIQRQGSLISVLDGEAELRLHDEPNGLIRFKGESGNITLDFPAGADVQPADEGARVAYEGGRIGHLLAENATWLDNDTVQLDGFFRYLVPPGEPAGQSDDHDAQVEEHKERAIEDRKLGAEISVKHRPPQATGLAPAQNDSVQVLAYDDVDVQVDLPEQAAPDTPLRVVVSSDLHEGRTIVLNVDEALLASTDPKDLVLRYFDLHNETDGSVSETEVVFAQASSLQDVLEPTDDGGQPEFWVVNDANGVQVLVSVPHWSAHAITVASIATVLNAPNVTVGIVAGAAASLVMGALLVWPRRRDDEL